MIAGEGRANRCRSEGCKCARTSLVLHKWLIRRCVTFKGSDGGFHLKLCEIHERSFASPFKKLLESMK